MGESFSMFAGGGKYKFKNFQDAQAHKKTFHAMRLRKGEVKKLFYKFRKWDKKNQRKLDMENLTHFIDIDSHGLSVRVFKVFDESGDGFVDFLEFILGCWNYCTSSKQTLALLAFDLYDSNTKGYMSVQDMEEMMKDFYGSNFRNNRHAKEALKKVASSCASKDPPRPGITIREFQNFCKTHQTMLYTVFTLQRRLQRKTLGLSKWTDIAERTAAVRKAGTFGLRAMKSRIENGNDSLPQCPQNTRLRRNSGQEGNLMGTLHSRRASMKDLHPDISNKPPTSSRRGTGTGPKVLPSPRVDDAFDLGQDGFSAESFKGPSSTPVSPVKHTEDTSLLDYLDDLVDETIDEGASFHEHEDSPTESSKDLRQTRASASAMEVKQLDKIHTQNKRRVSGEDNNLPMPLSSRRRSSASLEHRQTLKARRVSASSISNQNETQPARRKSSTTKMVGNTGTRTHIAHPSPNKVSLAAGTRRTSWASEDGTPREVGRRTSNASPNPAAARRGSADKYFLQKKR
mmetsp:Transcript_8514/g.11098  ORF Transcript_8514/g.11098 Transcript_8514/m.11098 type:complete len:514 (-) Transcript_8514:180-1721(-)